MSLFPPQKKKKQILLLHLKRIGDLILASNAIRTIQHYHPDSEITLVTGRLGGLAKKLLPDIKRTYTFHPFFHQLILPLLLRAKKWDICMDWSGNRRSLWLAQFAQAKLNCGNHWTFQKEIFKNHRAKALFQKLPLVMMDKNYAQDYYLKLSAPILPANFKPQGAQLKLPPHSEQIVRKLLNNTVASYSQYVVIHPCASKEEKMWAPHKWAKAADTLSNRGYEVILAGGNAKNEKLHAQAIHKAAQTKLINLVGKVNFTELACLMLHSSLILSVDSVAQHIAAILERPQVAIYGPTDPFEWQPLHPRGLVIGPHLTPGTRLKAKFIYKPDDIKKNQVEQLFQAIDLVQAG